MTYQEALWQGKSVFVVSMMTKSGKIHQYMREYVGCCGRVLGEAKNGMLLVDFQNRIRAIPASCVVELRKNNTE